MYLLYPKVANLSWSWIFTFWSHYPGKFLSLKIVTFQNIPDPTCSYMTLSYGGRPQVSTPTDPLHVTSHFGHVYIRLAAAMLGSECVAVIQRKALNVSLFTNASDYSNKTCMERSMCLYLTNMVVLLEYSHLRWWTTIWLVPFSQLPQYISDLQHSGSQTGIYGSVQMWHHCAMGLYSKLYSLPEIWRRPIRLQHPTGCIPTPLQITLPTSWPWSQPWYSVHWSLCPLSIGITGP